MKVLLNMLPTDRKKVEERKMRFRFFVWQVFLLFSLECILLGSLFGIFVLVDFERVRQESLGQGLSQDSEGDSQLKRFEEKFRSVNTKLEKVASINKNHFFFSNLFVILDRNMTETIMLERIGTKDFQLFISGIAETREDLLAFDERLKQDPCFTGVTLPLSNLLVREQVSFQIDIVVKESCLHDIAL